MRVLIAVTLAAVAIGVLGARADADAEATGLVGTVDDAANITLEHGDGTPVTILAPGEYELEVTDSTSSHNFHLTGPGGIDESTTISGQETVTWPLALAEGDYHYVCDAHAFMSGHFTVVGSSPPPPPPGPPPPGPPPPGPPPPGPPPPPSPPPPTPPPAPPPPPPPIQHPPPLAPPAALTRLSVRVAPGRVVVASVHAAAPTRASMELRRAARRVQSKRVSLTTGRNVLRMRIRRGVRAGQYLLVVRTTAGRALSHRLRLR
jgi:hypothetical protein